jgi:hypothetical protein
LPIIVCIWSKDDKEKLKKKQAKEKANNLLEFVPGSYWTSLAADSLVVPESVNTIQLARVPTILEEHATLIPKKYSFGQKFDRHVFLGMSNVEKHHRDGRIVRDSSGNII